MTWRSYHIYFEGGIGAQADDFLIRELQPEIQRQEAAGSLRRFFFIRYSEGGPHVRLRILPSSEHLGPQLEERLIRCALAGGGRLESRPYDRTSHYFGETPESVYAELLNIATSRLSLALLQSFGPERRGERWIALTCALGILLRHAAERVDPLSLRQDLTESRDFAIRAGHMIGLGPKEADPSAGRRWSSTMSAAWPQVVSGLPDELLEPTAKLLRRSRRRGPKGRDVAVHALHLLCNKTGFSLAEEHEAFATLAYTQPFFEEKP